MIIEKTAAGYLLLMNLLAFSVFGIDKRKAVRNRWRIPERTLLLTAALGGSIGALAGMHVFHHKTRKNKFRIGVPAILMLQIVIAAILVFSGILHF